MRKLLVSLLLGLTVNLIVCGQNPADSARNLYYESNHAINAGDFQRSEILLLRLLEYEYILSDSQVAMVLNNLGFVYYQKGRLEEAIVLFRRAEDLVSPTDPATLLTRISIHIHKALYFTALGDYTNSLLFSNEAHRLLSTVLVWNDNSYGKLSILLLNKGITLYLMGEYTEALGVLQECAQIKKAHNHAYLGSAYFNLARVHQSLGDFTSAREYYHLSIEQWVSEYDSSFFELANIYLHFGQFLTAQGQPEQGFEYLQNALQNYQLNYGPVHPLTAACYESLAGYYLDQGAWEDALAYLQLALHSIAGEFEMKDHFSNPDILSARHDLTFLRILDTKANALERASGNQASAEDKIRYLQAALATNRLSIDVLYKIRNTYLSSESRIYLNSQQKELFSSGIRLNLDLFHLTGIETFKEDAFLTAAHGKSGELMFEMKEKEWLYLESLPDTVALIATELKQQNSHLSNLIQIESMGRSPDSARMADLQNQLFQTQDSFNRQMEQLRIEFPQIDHFESMQNELSMEQIRRNLKRKEALVEYFVTEPGSRAKEQLYIFVITKKQCQVHSSTLDNNFHEHLQTITQMLHGFVPYNENKGRFDSLKLALYGAYEAVIQPVESHLSGRDLIVVPDEMLSYIPFDALISRYDLDSIANYAGLPYLLHSYNISYIYNSQLIRKHPSSSWRFPRMTAWIPAEATGIASRFGQLQGAADEVEEILKITSGRSIRKPLEKPELSTLLEENSILHLAMHSLATDSASRSPYFILDTISDPLLAHRMHDYEIHALDISSPMVVLSSCETAGGVLRTGEGIMSLSRSFLQAGASSVVHSLWPVDDVKSRDIMLGFYRKMKKGRPKSHALSEVKKQYINEQAPFYTHPYYWAAFQISGDLTPLHNKKRATPILVALLLVFLIFYGKRRRSFLRRV